MITLSPGCLKTEMKRFITGAIAALSVITPTASLANDSFEQHEELWQSLERAGVTVVVNTKADCSNAEVDGKYYIWRRRLAICQDNATVMNGKQVDWTANDLDTLRHEAHHVVQDCVGGVLADGDLTPLFEDQADFAKFITVSPMSKERITRIHTWLTENEANERDVHLELEAYLVADGVEASSIAAKIDKLCKAPKLNLNNHFSF